MAGPAWKYFTTQEQWKAYLQDLVSTNTNACLKAITCIDNWQTEPERQQGESTEENGVGWTKYDAKEMGQLANKIRNGQALTDGELAKAKNKMKKYWKQLMQISKRQMEQQEAEEQAKKKQETLKKQNGIPEDGNGMQVREKNAKDYLFGFLRGIIYVLFTVLVFIGLVTLINPGSRSMLFNMILQIAGR